MRYAMLALATMLLLGLAACSPGSGLTVTPTAPNANYSSGGGGGMAGGGGGMGGGGGGGASATGSHM